MRIYTSGYNSGLSKILIIEIVPALFQPLANLLLEFERRVIKEFRFLTRIDVINEILIGILKFQQGDPVFCRSMLGRNRDVVYDRISFRNKIGHRIFVNRKNRRVMRLSGG